MVTVILRRGAYSILTLFFVITLIFILLRLLPGDVVVAILGEEAYSLENAAVVRQELGLDKPIYEQYFMFLSNIARLDFGRSLISNRPVLDDIQLRLIRTAELVIIAVPLGTLVGLPFGVLAALKRDTYIDFVISIVSLAGISFPLFIVAYFLVLIFAVRNPLLPSSGFIPFLEDPSLHLKQLILPVLSLMFWPIAVSIRMTRSSLLEVLQEDYVRTARAKGLPERLVILRHALRNALIPVVSVVGLQIGTLLAGAIVVETVFSWPGIGLFLYDGLIRRDLPVVQGAVLSIAVIFIVVNLVVDVLYTIIDPRTR